MELGLEHVVPFLLVLSRLGGLFMFTPLLSSSAVPTRARALLAVMLAAAVYPALMGAGTVSRVGLVGIGSGTVDLASLGVLAASELLMGVTIGLLAAIPVLAVQVAGMIMGQQLGLGLAAVFNPAMETESDLVGELLLYLAIAVFMALGGLEVAFLSVVQSFDRVPPGGMGAGDAPLGLLVALVHSGFELALRVSAPVLCILMLETLAAGLVMKTMPQLNILSVGFAVKVVLGFMALAAAIYSVGDAVGEEMQRGLRAVLEWSAAGVGG